MVHHLGMGLVAINVIVCDVVVPDGSEVEMRSLTHVSTAACEIGVNEKKATKRKNGAKKNLM